MPRDLFGEVVHHSATIGGRKWNTLPLSIATHTLIIGTIVIVSLFSVDVLPTVPRFIPPYMAAVLEVPKVPLETATARPRSVGQDHATARPDAAPVVPPDGIKPDTGIVREPEPAASTFGVEGGLATGVLSSGGNVLPEAPPPPPPAPTTPIRLSAGVTAPVKIKDVRPIYTDLAQRAGIQGTVTIEAIISTDGKVINARVLRSIPLLDHAALDAVRQWTFTAGRLNNVPVAIIMTVTVTFTLQR